MDAELLYPPEHACATTLILLKCRKTAMEAYMTEETLPLEVREFGSSFVKATVKILRPLADFILAPAEIAAMYVEGRKRIPVILLILLPLTMFLYRWPEETIFWTATIYFCASLIGHAVVFILTVAWPGARLD